MVGNSCMDMIAYSTSMVVGGGISVATVWFQNDIGAAIVVFAILYIFVSSGGAWRYSMGTEIIFTMVSDSTLRDGTRLIVEHKETLVCIVFTFATIYYIPTAYASEKVCDGFFADSKVFSDWILFFLSGLPLASIIPMSLHLDFANHIASAKPGQHITILEVVQASTTDVSPSKQLAVVIPSTASLTFKCPYFASALLAWLLANVAVMQLQARGWLSDHNRFVYALGVFAFSLPMVVMSVVAVALMRGEMKRMWRYDGQWKMSVLTMELADINESGKQDLL